MHPASSFQSSQGVDFGLLWQYFFTIIFIHSPPSMLSSADGTVIAISSMTCGSTGEAGIAAGHGRAKHFRGCSRTTPYHDRDAAWQNHDDGTEEGGAPAGRASLSVSSQQGPARLKSPAQVDLRYDGPSFSREIGSVLVDPKSLCLQNTASLCILKVRMCLPVRDRSEDVDWPGELGDIET